MKKILCAALCVILCLGVFAACGSAKGPETLIEKMQKAIDGKDAKALLECYEPAVQELFKSMMGDNFESPLEEFEDEDGDKVTLKLDNVEYTNDDKTTANLTVSTTSGENTETQQMPVKLVDGDWYLDLAGAMGGLDD